MYFTWDMILHYQWEGERNCVCSCYWASVVVSGGKTQTHQMWNIWGDLPSAKTHSHWGFWGKSKYMVNHPFILQLSVEGIINIKQFQLKSEKQFCCVCSSGIWRCLTRRCTQSRPTKRYWTVSTAWVAWGLETVHRRSSLEAETVRAAIWKNKVDTEPSLHEMSPSHVGHRHGQSLGSKTERLTCSQHGAHGGREQERLLDCCIWFVQQALEMDPNCLISATLFKSITSLDICVFKG